MEQIKRFISEEDGLGTVEIVVILAVLVSVALIFRNNLLAFVNKAMTDIFTPDSGASTEIDKGKTVIPST